MTDAAATPKPSSSVKLVLLGEAAVGKVCCAIHHSSTSVPPRWWHGSHACFSCVVAPFVSIKLIGTSIFNERHSLFEILQDNLLIVRTVFASVAFREQ